jgi:pheromone shutdown protein TraB
VNECDDALVGDVLSGLCEALARLLADTNTLLTAERDELFEARIVAFRSDENVIKAATSGFESFFHRMQAVENFHEG